MTIQESAPSSLSTRTGENTIEVKLQELEQFFNTIDPSPFHEKDLDHDLEEFIVSWAKEYPLHESLRLVHLQKRSAPYLSKSDTPNLLAAPASLLHSSGLNLRFAILAPKIAIASRPSIGSGWGPRVSERLSEDVSSPSAHSSQFR